MLIEQIDGFDAQPLKTCIASAPDIFRRTVNASDAVGTEAEPEFGGDDHTITGYLAQKTAKQFFIGVGPVDLGGIKEIAAELQIAAKNAERFRFISRSISKGHAHATESQGRNKRTVASKLTLWHEIHVVKPPLDWMNSLFIWVQFLPLRRRLSFDTIKSDGRIRPAH